MSASESTGRLDRRSQAQLGASAVVDRTSLELLGFIFGGVTAVVIGIAAVVVRHHVNTPVAAEQSAPAAPASLSAQAVQH